MTLALGAAADFKQIDWYVKGCRRTHSSFNHVQEPVTCSLSAISLVLRMDGIYLRDTLLLLVHFEGPLR
jgi:hypothetical protein